MTSRPPADSSGTHPTVAPRLDELAQLRADAVLPTDIYPTVEAPFNTSSNILITGATGFLGRYVVKALLQQTSFHLICLLRADDEAQAWRRLWQALQSAHVGADPTLTASAVQQRISVVCGDLAQDNFGLSASAYQQLAQDTGSIFHCAALVNWARSYRRLRHINVLGTRRMIRFACEQQPKPLLFVSSLAVCFATNRDTSVDEDTDMLPHIEYMPLGYARSKCVAESLLRQAAQRGLPVTILRPALISGDTVSGVNNTEDFVAALLEGSTRLGLAMDTDWLLDFVPVDFVAEVVVKLCLLSCPSTALRARAGATFRGLSAVEARLLRHSPAKLTVLHLVDDRPRYWRELMLWLNLYGYPIRLVPANDWLAAAFVARQQVGNRLYAYRRFFQGLPSRSETGQKKPFECYLQPHQQLIDSTWSVRWLEQMGFHIPRLNADLLQCYLTHFQRAGLLSVPPEQLRQRRREKPDQAASLQILQRAYSLADIRGADLQPMEIESDDGILHQLSAAYGGAAIGLRAYRLSGHGESKLPTTEVIVKTKCSAELVKDSTVLMAELCSPRLGKLFQRFRNQLGLCHVDQREAALYELPCDTLRQYTPHCYGTSYDAATGLTTIVLERAQGAVPIQKLLVGACRKRKSTPALLYKRREAYKQNQVIAGIPPPFAKGERGGFNLWSGAQLNRVIKGLAQIHATPRTELAPLAEAGLLVCERSTAKMLEMAPLWRELVAFAAGQSEQAAKLLPLQQQYIDDLTDWWPQLLAQPQGLIHNDFNPRNLVLRNLPTGQLQLCAFDWELAGIGAPQRDFAEFLCFVLDTGSTTADEVYQLIDEHRQRYTVLTGQSLTAEEWQLGFALALRQFVLTRLPMYALMNRFRPQRFLPGVCANAWWLLRLFCHTA